MGPSEERAEASGARNFFTADMISRNAAGRDLVGAFFANHRVKFHFEYLFFTKPLFFQKNLSFLPGVPMLYMYSKKEEAMLALRLPEEIERRLEALAKRSGRSKSFYAREAILEHLDDLEATYLSDEILKRVETGQERTYTLDELERELGLAD